MIPQADVMPRGSVEMIIVKIVQKTVVAGASG